MAAIQFIVWHDDLSVGQAELDNHHQRMFAIINSLYDAVVAGAPREEINRIIGEVDDYARVHFAAEEDALSSVGYPRLPDQRQAHLVFTRKLAELHGMPLAPYRDLAQEILHFLKEWWLHHIVHMDKAFAPYLSPPLPGQSPLATPS